MKNKWLPYLCYSILFYGILSAHTKDDILQVHKAAHPPVIDGQMDPIYLTASTERVIMADVSFTSPEPDSYLDYFGEMRVLWDDNFIYIFTKITDDEISFSLPNPWLSDSITYYFDGNNSKTDGYPDDVDDILLRIAYQNSSRNDQYQIWPENVKNSTVREKTEGAVADWVNPTGAAAGYAIEAAFPLAELNIQAKAGSVFGFEIQITESDEEAVPENVFSWKNNTGATWNSPILWGTAELTDYAADDVMNVMPAPAAPIIDGVRDDLWEEASEINMGTYVFSNYDVIGGEYTEITTWEDAQFSFRTLWDQNNFYLWCEVIDDIQKTGNANPWDNDGIEIFFDGNNDKSESLDGNNDTQWIWAWTQQYSNSFRPGNETFAWGGQFSEYEGYTFELKIPAENLPFNLEQDKKIGFEIQIDDRDNQNRENILHWWGSDNGHWSQPVRFGTILLAGIEPDSPPSAFTLSPDSVTITSAVLRGQVNPNEMTTKVQFQYGKGDGYSQEIEAAQSPVNGLGQIMVSADIEGLAGNTSYLYRVTAINESGTSMGEFRTFKTLPYAPVTNTDDATDILIASAVLKGSVNPNGDSTSVKFQYGKNTSYGFEINASPNPVTGSSSQTVTAEISALIPNTTYHYRVVAKNNGGTSLGNDQTFKTIANKPMALTNPAEVVSSVYAVLLGSVNPQGDSTTVKFQYGTTRSYGHEIDATQSPLTGTSSIPVTAVISELTPSTTYHYCVFATNSGGTTQGGNKTFITLPYDNPPVITHSPISSLTMGQSAIIKTSVTDDHEVSSVTLYYRPGGKTDYTSIPMPNTGSDIFEGTIPLNSVTERGVEYYISTSDNSGHNLTIPDPDPSGSPYSVRVGFQHMSCTYPTPANSYRMISAPGELYKNSPVSVLEDDFGSYNRTEWRLLRGQNGVYVEYSIGSIENFTPGRAFWLITKDAKNWDVESGTSVSTAGNYSIDLSTGWNQIGNPFAFPVAWSDVVKNNAVEALWAYETTGGNASGYVLNPTQLLPWKGYCVYNNTGHSTTLEIPPREAPGTAKTSTLPILSSQPGEWIVQIMALCGSASDIDNYAGCLQSAEEEWDPNDFREPTPIGEYVSLSFPHDEWKQSSHDLAGDFRPADGQGHEWTFSVRTNISRSAVHLTFEGFQYLPEGIQTVLIDETAKCRVNPAETQDYTFLSGSAETNRSFRLIAGQDQYVDENTRDLDTPQTCCLYPNSPNPFNASTLISYSIPSQNIVSLKIYDMLGRLILNLEKDNEKSPGRHTVIWDGKDQQGSAVPSGVYVIALTAGDHIWQRKILLIK